MRDGAVTFLVIARTADPTSQGTRDPAVVPMKRCIAAWPHVLPVPKEYSGALKTLSVLVTIAITIARILTI
jgi:hypothetical protein